MNILNWIALTNWPYRTSTMFDYTWYGRRMAWQRVIWDVPWRQADYRHDRELPVAWISIWSLVCWKSPKENLRQFLENLEHGHFPRSTEFQWYLHYSLALWQTKLLNKMSKLIFLRSIKYTQHKKLTRHCLFNNTSHKGSIRACSLSKTLNLCLPWIMSPRALLSVWFLC